MLLRGRLRGSRIEILSAPAIELAVPLAGDLRDLP
jgi:hypothetical protein